MRKFDRRLEGGNGPAPSRPRLRTWTKLSAVTSKASLAGDGAAATDRERANPAIGGAEALATPLGALSANLNVAGGADLGARETFGCGMGKGCLDNLGSGMGTAGTGEVNLGSNKGIAAAGAAAASNAAAEVAFATGGCMAATAVSAGGTAAGAGGGALSATVAGAMPPGLGPENR